MGNRQATQFERRNTRDAVSTVETQYVSIKWPNFIIVWLPFLREILGDICFAIVC